MENSDFFYVPDELHNKGEVKHLISYILGSGLLLFAFYALVSYTIKFPITEYLSLYAFIWSGLTICFVVKFLGFQAELKPDMVLGLLKDCSGSPKLKDTLLNIINVQGKIKKIDIYRILYVLRNELSELYEKNCKNLIGIEIDQQAKIIAKGEAEIESYTKSIAVLENTLNELNFREKRNR